MIASVVLYAVVFLVASGLMIALPVETMGFKILMPILAAVFTYFISNYFYFKSVTISKPLMDGLMLGIVFVVVAFLLDVPLMVYYFAAEQGWSYFTQWNLILGYLLMLIVPILAAYMKK